MEKEKKRTFRVESLPRPGSFLKTWIFPFIAGRICCFLTLYHHLATFPTALSHRSLPTINMSAEPTTTAAATEPTTTTETPAAPAATEETPKETKAEETEKKPGFLSKLLSSFKKAAPKKEEKKVEEAPPTLPEPVTEDAPAAAAAYVVFLSCFSPPSLSILSLPSTLPNAHTTHAYSLQQRTCTRA
ncbi:hypothetical protein BDZ89DRAFT_601512 [Hymenopellis radicata]|nr:hypothetical protein BDZ89DRAFT_601512 [Hymenopellis radicata]